VKGTPGFYRGVWQTDGEQPVDRGCPVWCAVCDGGADPFWGLGITPECRELPKGAQPSWMRGIWK